jgi:hypothetical protein
MSGSIQPCAQHFLNLMPDVRIDLAVCRASPEPAVCPAFPDGQEPDVPEPAVPGRSWIWQFCQDLLSGSGDIYYICGRFVKISYFWHPAGSRVTRKFFLLFNVFYHEIFVGLKKPMYLCTRKPKHDAKVLTI